MFTSTESQETGLYRFISRWALFGGLAELALVIMMMAFVMPVSQGSGLSDDFMELIAAGKIPGLYRFTILLDASVWLAIGGLLLMLAALLYKDHPKKSLLIAAAGIAQISGFTGALLRLEGTLRLAGEYLSATAVQKANILQSYLDLQTDFNAHFDAGSLLYSVSFLLVAVVIWRMDRFPRWLGLLFGLAGVLNLANEMFNLGGHFQFMLFFLALLAEIATFIGTSIVFWQRQQKAVEVKRGMA